MIKYLLLLPLTLCAFDLNPWFNPILDLKKSAAVGYRGGNRVDAFYLRGSLETTVWTDIKAEIDVTAAKTNKNGFSFESIRITGLYRFWNDILGDPLTVVGGFSLGIPRTAFRRDISVFEPSPLFLEGHLVLGVEEQDCIDWSAHKWAYITFGVGTKASCWLKTKILYDINLYDYGYVSFSAATLTGFGSRRWLPFHTYAHVAYRELAGGVSYNYECYRLSLVQTLYRRHYPSTTTVELEVSF